MADKDSRQFIISCGGTGGHLSPGIALAQRLNARGHHCCLVVSRKRIDARIIENYPEIEFRSAPGVGLSFSPVGVVRFMYQQALCFVFSYKLLREKEPDAVIAFGGFLTFGIGAVSFVLGVPLAMHEANRVPGKATRLLGRLADRLYLPDGIKLKGVPLSATRYMGFPLRKEMRRWPKEQARRELKFPLRGKILLVMGGSQGASSLNNWVGSNFSELAAEGVSVILLTGPGKGTDERIEKRSFSGETVFLDRIAFTNDMACLLSAADLVVGRAGAGTIAELIAMRVPSILIPYPYAADDHQKANADYLERQGGCIVIQEEEMTGLLREVKDAIFNDWLMAKFRENLRRLHSYDKTDAFVEDFIRFAQGSRDRRPMVEAPSPQ